MNKFCARCDAYHQQELIDFVHDNREKPVLISYGSDATHHKITFRHIARMSGDGARVVRYGKAGSEFLIQRIFALARDHVGNTRIATRPFIPLSVPVTNTVLDNFGPLQVNFPRLRSLGVRGLCLQHVAFDGKFFEPLTDLAARHVESQYTGSREMMPDDAYPHALLHLLDWLVGTRCVMHIFDTALVWSTKSWTYKDLHDDMFIFLESLRNSANKLLLKLQSWMMEKVAFDDRNCSEQEVI